MNLEFVRYEKRNRIAFVTINRPEVMNALHPPASEEMSRVWEDVIADPEVWVAIVTGAGDRAFSAGNDLKWTAQHGMPRMPKGGFGGLTTRDDLWKPVIAAVNGVALGGGLEIALACDIIIASENARMGLPEPRVGLAALAGGMHRLPRQIGLKNAMGMMLTGRHIDAQEAYRLGLVQEVAAPDKLMERALAWANEISQCSPISVRTTKEVALSGLGRPLEEAMHGRYDGISKLFSSEDFIEGPMAFAQKRKPQWKGR